jgi:hypothetical protein
MAESTNPFDRLIDLAVYAPVGLAVELRKQVPAWAKSGRSEVDNRVKLARMIGKFAVTQGRVELVKRLDQLAADRAAAAAVPVIIDVDSHRVDAESTVLDAAQGVLVPMVSVDLDSLPIAAYDSLAASQVVARLDALSPDELEAVHGYERAHRGRRTILGKIAQLQAA